MKQWIKYSLPLAMGIIGLSASAAPITGTVHMDGSVNLDNQSLLMANNASFNANAGHVDSGTGSYSTTAGAVVQFTGFSFGATGPEVVNKLWDFSVAGVEYSFNLSSITSVARSTTDGINDLLIHGLGTVSIGADTSAANWSFDITDTDQAQGSFTFGFTQSDTATVPDGGMTVMMLGAAFTGLSLIKRKLA